MNAKRTFAAAALSLALIECGRGEVRFDMSRPPAWLKRIDRLGSNVQAAEIQGGCFQRFTGSCTADVLPSRTWMRKAVLRLAAGNEARVSFQPVEGAPVSMMVDRGSDAKMRVRKNGGRLVVECTSALPGEGCELALVTTEAE